MTVWILRLTRRMTRVGLRELVNSMDSATNAQNDESGLEIIDGKKEKNTKRA